MSNFIQNFKTYCESLETPDTMIEAGAYFTLASICDKKFTLQLGHHPIDTALYFMLVGRQGLGKSAGLKMGINLIRKNSGRKNIITTCSASSRALKDEIERIGEDREVKIADFDPINVYRNYHKITPTSVTIAPDEAKNHFDISKDEMVGLYVEAYNYFDLQIEHLTAHHGQVHIEKPYINFCGPCVPAWLESAFKDELLEGGFGRRCIWVYEEKKRFSNPLPKITKQALEAEELCHNRICDILLHKGGEFTMSVEAEKWYESWYVANDSREPTLMESYYDNKRMHLCKLAMLHSIAEKDELRLDKRNFLAANEFLGKLEVHMHKVFENSCSNEEYPIRLAILNFIKESKDGKVLWTTILNNAELNKRHKKQELREALETLVDQEKIIPEIPPGSAKKYYKVVEQKP